MKCVAQKVQHGRKQEEDLWADRGRWRFTCERTYSLTYKEEVKGKEERVSVGHKAQLCHHSLHCYQHESIETTRHCSLTAWTFTYL